MNVEELGNEDVEVHHGELSENLELSNDIADTIRIIELSLDELYRALISCGPLFGQYHLSESTFPNNV